MRPVYVTGHKNPDTDSIVSSIAYAIYKKKHDGISAIAGRIGPVNSDTEWLLERFGYEDPLHLYTAKSTVREIDFDKAVLAEKDLTLKEALDKMNNTKNKSLFVADKNRHLLGLVSLSNITDLWLSSEKTISKILKTSSLKNITKVLKGKILVKPVTFKLNGLVDLSPVLNAKLAEGTIAITSNATKVKNAIKQKAGLVIVLNNIEIDNKTIELAKKNDVALMTTSLSAIKVSKDIYLTPSIETIMTDVSQIVTLQDSLTVQDAGLKIANSRFRSYPIIDGHNTIIGAISRYHLFKYEKKKLILVDHNEKKQSIDDIEFGEVIEIVDHHRYGSFETEYPINITVKNVGSTSTIIAEKFIDDKIKIDKNLAGLLLGGIVSDTLNFKSPTTTKLDEKVAKILEEIAGVKADEINKGLINASASLLKKRTIDIVYDDNKEFNIGSYKVGLSQAICRNYDELKAIRTPVTSYIEEVVLTQGYDLFVMMFTDPNGSGSYLISRGPKQNIINQIYPKMLANGFVNHLISRKKQLLPDIIEKICE